MNLITEHLLSLWMMWLVLFVIVIAFVAREPR